MHSEKFDTVKKYYKMGMWNLARVRNAVVMKWITAAEYQEITGQVYS